MYRLKKNSGLPDVVFHSLRHFRSTYKLKVNHGGDIEATQGDTGHVQPDMVTQVYSHILDQDCKVNAQRFEAAFHANADIRPVERSLREKAAPPPSFDLAGLVQQLEENPELASALSELLNRNAAQG